MSTEFYNLTAPDSARYRPVMAQGIKKDKRTDSALHDIVTGTGNTRAAQNKRWWAQRLMGPEREKYARMLMGLPPKENDE